VIGIIYNLQFVYKIRLLEKLYDLVYIVGVRIECFGEVVGYLV